MGHNTENLRAVGIQAIVSIMLRHPSLRLPSGLPPTSWLGIDECGPWNADVPGLLLEFRLA
jgi:hypothetical protein